MRRASLLLAVLFLLAPTPASTQEGCSNVLVYTIPGVRWGDVDRLRPPEIVRAIEDGAAATMAVRTNIPITGYASGFLTIGTGSRANARTPWGGPIPGEGLGEGGSVEQGGESMAGPVRVTGLEPMQELADEAGYGAEPGSLGSALDSPLVAIGNSDPGMPVPVPYGFGRYALLAAMDEDGTVDRDLTGPEMLTEDPTAPFGVRTDPTKIVDAVEEVLGDDDCATAIVDPGDLIRVDMASHIADDELVEERERAIADADDLLGELRPLLDDEDLLIVVSPTSPRWDQRTHLGVAIAVGPGYEPGTTMRSASTNLDGVVTLPDIGPTVIDHQGVDRPPEMLGRTWLAVPSDSEDRIESLHRFNREAVYMHHVNPFISTAFVITQALIYAFAIAMLWKSEGRAQPAPWLLRVLRFGALTVVAFPLATYLSTPFEAHQLRLPLLIPALLAIDAALVAIATYFLSDPLDRLFALVAATFSVVVVDQFFGGPLQLNAVWGIDPVVAGRFAGLGNISFAILGTTGLLTGALLVRKRSSGRALIAAAAIFALVVITDGAPNLGADVGGVLALVPALGLTFMMLTDRRPNWKMVALLALGAIAALSIFLIVDLSQPPESRTHLARLFEDVRDRGAGAFTDVIARKARANLRLFKTSIWTYLVPVALGLLAYLVLRPKGAWRRMAGREPKLRAALMGGMLLAVFGFAVNDSGIVIPAMALSYLVPLALVFHLTAPAQEPVGPRPPNEEPVRPRPPNEEPVRPRPPAADPVRPRPPAEEPVRPRPPGPDPS